MMITQTSGDAFSPALGRLVDCWGFGPPGLVAVAPRADHIIALLPTCDARRLAFEPDTRRLRQPGGVALDLSGIAKGYVVDALGAMQRAMGVRHGPVEVGGELTRWGMQPARLRPAMWRPVAYCMTARCWLMAGPGLRWGQC